MKLKYLIGIFIVFLLLVSVSFAKDISELTDEELNNLNYFDKVTEFNLEGFNFTIPSGYGYLEDYSVNETDSNGVTQIFKFFTNKNQDVISISILYGDDINLDVNDYKPSDVEDLEKETINGHTGWSYEYNDYNFFTYIDNKNIITIQAPDDDVLEFIFS